MVLAWTGWMLGIGKAGPLDHWPQGAEPSKVGKTLAEDFLTREFRYQTQPAKAHLGVIYPEICAWYGALALAHEAEDPELSAALIAKFEPYVSGDLAQHINRSAHVDYRMFGTLPLEIFTMNGDPRCLELGLSFANAQWETTTEDGITTEARYWIDDMYMIPILQVQAYRASGKIDYLHHASRALRAYLAKLQQPNGLFYHGPDSRFYWGRGNGWVAVGLAEVLRSMPQNDPDRAELLLGYRTMMAALLACQAESGRWRQLLDDPESWEETSGTGMFTFAFATGVKNQWLDAEVYGPAARKAWLALVEDLEPNGQLRGVCIGTDKGPSREFYLERPRATGDLHGQAAMLWAAAELTR